MFKKNRIFIFLWICCILGSWALIPSSFFERCPASVPFFKFILLTTIQTAILYGFLLWLCCILLPKTDLQPFAAEESSAAYFNSRHFLTGIFTGLVIFVLDVTFHQSLLSTTHPPFRWGLFRRNLWRVQQRSLKTFSLHTLLFYFY